MSYHLSVNAATKPSTRTFTENARRAQIVQSAIETIAELGYARASFAQIARRAGLSSTGLISYHFAGKRELVEQVIAAVYAEIRAFATERMPAPDANAAARLRAYIEGNVEFIGAHRPQMKALLAIFLSGELDYDAHTDQQASAPVEAILRAGQQSGEFRVFDPRVMATVIQRAVDGLPFVLEATPDLDLDSYAAELVTLFDLATRRGT
jgi:AcrR family transcriptional regulator